MKVPETPENESNRLKDLNSLNILDTPSEERFDRLTRMAKRMFNVPIALVSLVDENRQWFKSCIGLSVSETTREISFCGHAILGDNIFVVADTAKDKRFADNPLVLQEPFIRFYAGCPIKLPTGSKVGTLCIIDLKPRYFEKEDFDFLRDLAAMVESEIAALQIATIDELTGISNRRGFLSPAQSSMDYGKRNKVPETLVFFDINGLKEINDNYGHLEGDKALSTFAEQLDKKLRDSDIFARLGGDEFVALLTNTNAEGAKVVVSKIQSLLDSFNAESAQAYQISFSHGIVEFDRARHQSIEDLLADGDSLMYECKKAMKKLECKQ